MISFVESEGNFVVRSAHWHAVIGNDLSRASSDSGAKWF
jgi:hypothetical protein